MPFSLTSAEMADIALLAVPVVIAALLVFFWRRSRARARLNWVVLDGSNVMHWRDNTPDLGPVRDVLRQLDARGYAACVIFDANAGYLLFNRYGRESDFSALLKIPQKRVMVVPKGTPADPYILTAARDLGALIVTNDRYRDWADSFPELRGESPLIRGGYRGRSLWLDLPEPGEAPGRKDKTSRRAS